MWPWKYNGVAPFNTLVEWCRTHVGTEDKDWVARWETIYFFEETDYIMFLLRWGG